MVVPTSWTTEPLNHQPCPCSKIWCGIIHSIQTNSIKFNHCLSQSIPFPPPSIPRVFHHYAPWGNSCLRYSVIVPYTRYTSCSPARDDVTSSLPNVKSESMGSIAAFPVRANHKAGLSKNVVDCFLRPLQ